MKFTRAKQIDEKFHGMMIVMSRTPNYVVTVEQRLRILLRTKTKKRKRWKKRNDIVKRRKLFCIASMVKIMKVRTVADKRKLGSLLNFNIKGK